MFDLEDEDNMAAADLLVEDDFFIKSFITISDKSEAQIEIGLLEVEVTDFNMRKIIETLVVDWP